MRVFTFLVSLLILQIFHVNAQKLNGKSLVEVFKEQDQKDPKRELEHWFDSNFENWQENIRKQRKALENEVYSQKFKGDLWVLEYQYKLTDDATFLKPIVQKRAILNGLFTNGPSINYFEQFLKVTPSDSLFSNDFLPYLLEWAKQVNYSDTVFTDFRNMDFKNEKYNYIRDRIIKNVVLKWFENSWQSSYCSEELESIKKLELDLAYSEQIDFFEARSELSILKKELEVLTKYSHYSYGYNYIDSCELSLFEDVHYKLLKNYNTENNKEFIKELFLKIFSLYNITDFTNSELDSLVNGQYLDQLKRNSVNRHLETLNNLVWHFYKDENYTERCLKIINTVLENEENHYFLDTKANILFQLKRYKEAKEFERKAIELCKDCKNKTEYLETLKRFEIKLD